MHIVLPKRSSGEWRLIWQNDSQMREKLTTLDPGRGTLRVEVSAHSDRRPGYTQRQRQLVKLKKEPVHSAV